MAPKGTSEAGNGGRHVEICALALSLYVDDRMFACMHASIFKKKIFGEIVEVSDSVLMLK